MGEGFSVVDTSQGKIVYRAKDGTTNSAFKLKEKNGQIQIFAQNVDIMLPKNSATKLAITDDGSFFNAKKSKNVTVIDGAENDGKKYADEIIADIEASLKKESNIDSILSAVYQKIILKLGEPRTISLGDKPKVIFFIGPTGVGKTTTIAKIASHFKLEKYTKVAFITSDTYRIAAVEQLNTYASIIDCPVNVAYSPDEMDECLDEFKTYELILVDTAGRSHKSEEQMEELDKLIETVEQRKDEFDFEIYLTLSVTTKYKDLVNIADKYKHIKDWAIIFTKLDETCSLGNMLNMKLYTGEPLSYTTSGQNVPNDIEVINEQRLAKLLLGGKS